MAFQLENPGDIECCTRCDNPHDDCTCPECSTCCEKVHSDDYCEACEQCESCCECVTCPACNKRGDLDLCESCGECDDCCECVTCSSCGERGRFDLCPHCECCENCCDCASCDHCGELFYRDDMCYDCCCCTSCCECRSENGIFRSNGTHWYRAKRTQHKQNPSKRLVGCEIEVDRYADASPIGSAADRWTASIVSDGSLGAGSFELVTSPASGDVFCDMIDDIGRALSEGDASVNNDCGLHVHIDARDYTFYDMRRLIHLYTAVEKALFDTQPDTRRGNHYCSPCGTKLSRDMASALRPKDSKRKLLENVYNETPGKRTRSRRGDKYDCARYYALNLHSWLYRGTVECRLHSGTTKAYKIKAWAMLWCDLLDYALRATEREIRERAKDLTKADAKEWLLEIAKTETVRNYLRERWARFERD